MHINPVDQNHNLFDIGEVYSQDLVEKILATSWLDQPWRPQLYQETWPRRRVDLVDMPWANEWAQQTRKIWFRLSVALRLPLRAYQPEYTYFWIDMPGFSCDIHTDGSLPAAMQLAWHGRSDQGTCFYQDQDRQQFRFRSRFEPNHGYVMTNHKGVLTAPGLWHDMPATVALDEFRVTSYTLIHLLNGAHPL